MVPEGFPAGSLNQEPHYTVGPKKSRRAAECANSKTLSGTFWGYEDFE
jgi:hypothetical protein